MSLFLNLDLVCLSHTSPPTPSSPQNIPLSCFFTGVQILGTIFLFCQWYYLAKLFLFEKKNQILTECLGFQFNLLTLAVLERIHQ